jgi:hypothetical protein
MLRMNSAMHVPRHAAVVKRALLACGWWATSCLHPLLACLFSSAHSVQWTVPSVWPSLGHSVWHPMCPWPTVVLCVLGLRFSCDHVSLLTSSLAGMALFCGPHQWLFAA